MKTRIVTVAALPTRRLSDDGDSFIVPPSSITVDLERKPVLFIPGNKALVRVPGY